MNKLGKEHEWIILTGNKNERLLIKPECASEASFQRPGGMSHYVCRWIQCLHRQSGLTYAYIFANREKKKKRKGILKISHQVHNFQVMKPMSKKKLKDANKSEEVFC